MAEKDLKQDDRGAYNYRADQNTGTRLVKWYHNKCVLVGSACAGVEVTTKLERFYVKQKKVQVQCCDMVAQHNASMGGIDLADMLVKLCRTKITTENNIFHWFDIAKINASLIYCRHCGQ